ncbi:hypothetical protein ACEQPO_28090 [Bacillus sp. SL00103]
MNRVYTKQPSGEEVSIFSLVEQWSRRQKWLLVLLSRPRGKRAGSFKHSV